MTRFGGDRDTSGVDDDVVEVEVLEGVDGLAGEVQGLFFAAGVGGEGAAAALVFGGYDLAALGGEDANGGGVDLGEEDLLHAAGQERHAQLALALGAIDAGWRRVACRRQGCSGERDEPAQPLRQRAGERSREPRRAHRRAEAAGARQDAGEQRAETRRGI